jgi:hypothetical protein
MSCVAGDNQDLAPLPLGLAQRGGDFPDGDPLRLFAGDRAGHETERLARRHIPLLRQHTHAVAAHDHEIAPLHFGHHDTGRDAGLRIDADGRVHFLSRDRNPFPGQPDFRVFVRRAIKAFREHPVRVHDLIVAILLVDRNRAVPGDGGQHAVEFFARRRTDRQPRDARIDPAASDFEVLDAERPAQIHDLVEHLRQQEAVDDVARQFHFLDDRTVERVCFGDGVRTGIGHDQPPSGFPPADRTRPATNRGNPPVRPRVARGPQRNAVDGKRFTEFRKNCMHARRGPAWIPQTRRFACEYGRSVPQLPGQ